MQRSKEQQGEVRKPSSVISAKKQRETIEWERIEISSRRLEIPREHFMQRWAQIKDKNGIDLTETEDIKKRWQKYIELYEKTLQDPDNTHDGVITVLEPDILKCEVKWALGIITMNKACGGDGIPVELFQILKDDAVRVLDSICQQIWETQQRPRTRKCQFSFQSQRKAMPRNAQTTTPLHSSHILAK